MTRAIAAAFLLLAIATAGCVGEGDGGGIRSVSIPAAILHPAFTAPVWVEIDYMEGGAPSKAALDALYEILPGATAKEVDFQPPTLARHSVGKDHRWDSMDLVQRVLAEQDHVPAEGEGYLHVVYVRGTMTYSGATYFGMALADHVVIFIDHLTDHVVQVGDDGPGVRVHFRERAVLLHETGHVLGLVGCGIPAVRPRPAPADPDGCHSANEGSVMFVGQHSFLREQGSLELVMDNYAVPYRFDADDVADIRAFQHLTLDELEAQGHIGRD